MSDQTTQVRRDKFRRLSGPLAKLVNGLFAAVTLLGCLWAAGAHDWVGWVLFTQQYLATVLGIGLFVCFLAVKARADEPEDRGIPWYDWLAAAGCLGVMGYIAVRYPVLVNDLGSRPPERWVLGIISVALIFEATRRTVGKVLVWLATAGILYTAFSHLMPGDLYAPSSEWNEIATYLYLDGNGIVGLPIRVFSTIIITFILFGQTLYALKGDKILNDAAISLMGRYRGGPAKVAVAGSSLFGTISGSVVSNVMMDGPVTIPMMVRAGYSSHLAAAIEAVASNGGQILPPVMGITAFLIADWLNVPYAEVVLAALIPAVLYYVALFIQVDLEAGRRGMTGLPAAEIPPAGPVLRRSWVFIVPLGVLVYTLLIAAWHPGKAALAAVLVALVVGSLNKETRPNPATIWHAVVSTGKTLLDLIVIVAIAGIFIGSLQLSGLAFNLSLILITFAVGSLILLLVITSVLCIFLGMGLPTAIIYILLASLVAPALVEFGIPTMAAHMFLFYFGTLSSLTPPLCFATFAAATIAGCDFWKAGWAGVRLAFVAYVVPFVFVLQPELLMIGSATDIALTVTSSVIGVGLMAAALAGYLFGLLSMVQRALLVVAGLCFLPSPAGGAVFITLNAIGFALALGVLVPQYMRREQTGQTGTAA